MYWNFIVLLVLTALWSISKGALSQSPTSEPVIPPPAFRLYPEEVQAVFDVVRGKWDGEPPNFIEGGTTAGPTPSRFARFHTAFVRVSDRVETNFAFLCFSYESGWFGKVFGWRCGDPLPQFRIFANSVEHILSQPEDFEQDAVLDIVDFTYSKCFVFKGREILVPGRGKASIRYIRKIQSALWPSSSINLIFRGRGTGLTVIIESISEQESICKFRIISVGKWVS